MGVDLLNPVQADTKGMEPEKLKHEFGDRLSFHGGIDIMKTLPRGTVDDVKEEVAERIRVLGQNGGYVLTTSHHIQSDTPLENIFAMYDLANRYQLMVTYRSPYQSWLIIILGIPSQCTS